MEQQNFADEITCVHKEAKSWILQYGKMAVGRELDVYQAQFGSNASCHEAGHAIGEALLDAFHGDLSSTIAACAQGCNSGCVHGATLRYVARYGLDALLKIDPEQACTPSASGSHRCFHGFGHGYLVAENYNVQKALTLCSRLAGASWEKYECSSGVFMELFSAAAGESHQVVPPELYRREGDLFYPCNTPEVLAHQGFAWTCFVQQAGMLEPYALQHHLTLLQTCAQASTELWQDACASGVGLQIVSTNSNAQGKVSQVCDAASSDSMRRYCLYGAYYFMRTGSSGVEDARRFCEALSPQDRYVCDPAKVNWMSLGISP